LSEADDNGQSCDGGGLEVASAGREVSRGARLQRYGHHGAIVWLTGLSGAGKSTLANRAEAHLFAEGYLTYVLDGDVLRAGVSSDLGFSAEGRHENIRRAGAVAALFADAGMVVLVAMISPFTADRAAARRLAGSRFHEVFVQASLEACERRDPRGLYRKARAGAIRQFTGVSSPYEQPPTPDLTIDTERLDVAAAVERLVSYIMANVPLRRPG
jgi:adenylyl-sulfate kinase